MKFKKTKTFLMVSLLIMIVSYSNANIPSNLKAENDQTESNVKIKENSSVKISVTEDSQDFIMGYSSKSDEILVKNWLTNNLDVEIVRSAIYRPTIHFKSNNLKGLEVASLLTNQKTFDIRYIHDNFIYEIADVYTPNDPLLENQTYIEQIEADMAWRFENGSSSVKVAVIDMGCELEHPDLSDNIDILNDWDFIGEDGDGIPQCIGDSDNQHGTQMAGVIGAIQNNNMNITGLAYVTIINLRVGYVEYEEFIV